MATKPSRKHEVKSESGEKKGLPPRSSASSSHFQKLFSPSAKPAPPEPVRQPLGPNIEVPPEFFVAVKKLTEKLLGSLDPSVKGKGHGQNNILSIHVGQKRVKGKPTMGLAVIVKVLEKSNLKKVQAKYRIPRRLKVGKIFVPVDVQVGRLFLPHAIGGDICGLSGKSPGSLGCFCYKLTTDANGNAARVDLLLTNNHVIGSFVNADPNEKVFEFDQNLVQGDVIAHDISMGTSIPLGLSIDAAVSNVTDNIPEANMTMHEGLRFNNNIAEVQVGDTVLMHGAKTHGTQGKVIDVDPVDPPVVQYDAGRFQIRKAIFIRSNDGRPFSEAGDSGSLIVNEAGNPVALLVGGDPNDLTLSLAQDLLTIQSDLNFDAIHPVP